MFIGYHASHEQFSPRELLDLMSLVEDAGFSGVMSSDHFAPWSIRQGESGFTWSWLGSALERTTSLPFGSLAIPGGWRCHPAILAQAIATLSQMYPNRLRWIAAGSGEYMNEHIAVENWPNKNERHKRMIEGVNIIRSLLRGETVHNEDGLIPIHNAKLWTLPKEAPLIYAAALCEETAKWAGSWADGLITVRISTEKLQRMINAFHDGGGTNKPVILQLQFSWAPTLEEAKKNAWHQWRHAALDMDRSKIKTPEEFDKVCEHVTIDDVAKKIPCFTDLSELNEMIDTYSSLGFSEIYLHNAGKNQKEFIEAFKKNQPTSL